MTPKEKAEELFDKYFEATNNYYQAKQCALIAVHEILKAVDNPDETYLMKHSVNYWTEVKKEIEKL
jgi:hypothetical protein